MRPLIAVLALLAALPLSAQVLKVIEFDPPLPDSSMPVQVRLAGINSDSCVPSKPRAYVNGHAITITVETPSAGACLLVVTPWGERGDVGRLAPGEYDVVVLAPPTGPGQFESVVLGQSHLTVTDAAQPFDITPSVAPLQPGSTLTQIELSPDIFLCPASPPCSTVESVTFGGIGAAFQVTSSNILYVTPPPHAAGPVDVEVKLSEQAPLHFTAFRYFDPSAAPDPVAFDRVLFPVYFRGAGAFGSFWNTDAGVENRLRAFIGEWRTITIFTDCSVAAACTGPVRPLGSSYVATTSRERGLLYFPERRNAAALRYSLHVRDTSREASDLGTEVPVITPRETSWDLSILDIPADDRFRRTLRLYDIDGAERNVTILVRPMGSLAAAEVTAADLTTGCTTAACDAPAYAVVDLDPLVKKLGATRVRVQVVSRVHDARLWAVVTTTNNDTQHVTAYTPQPRP